MRYHRIEYYRKGESDMFMYDPMPNVIPRVGEHIVILFKNKVKYKVINIIYDIDDNAVKVIVK